MTPVSLPTISSLFWEPVFGALKIPILDQSSQYRSFWGQHTTQDWEVILSQDSKFNPAFFFLNKTRRIFCLFVFVHLLCILTHLEDGDGIRVGQPLHENAPPAPSEVSPLNAVTVSFSPVQPVVVSCDPVGPTDTVWHNTGHTGSIHVAPVDTSRSVSPVSPEHQTVGHRDYKFQHAKFRHHQRELPTLSRLRKTLEERKRKRVLEDRKTSIFSRRQRRNRVQKCQWGLSVEHRNL